VSHKQNDEQSLRDKQNENLKNGTKRKKTENSCENLENAKRQKQND